MRVLYAWSVRVRPICTSVLRKVKLQSVTQDADWSIDLTCREANEKKIPGLRKRAENALKQSGLNYQAKWHKILFFWSSRMSYTVKTSPTEIFPFFTLWTWPRKEKK